MKAKIIFTFIFSAAFFMAAFAQDAKSDDGTHFLVDFGNFSPPISAIAESFEGKPTAQFLANDITEQEHFLGDYKGKKVILWF